MPGLRALGFTVVWVGFAVGLIAIYLAAVADQHPPRSVAVIVASGATMVALFAPAIRGTTASTGERITLTAWSGLDPITVATTTAVLVVAAVRTSWPCALSAVLMLGGNLLIQLDPDRATEVAWGLPLAFGCSLAALAAALVAARRVSGAG